MSSPGAWVLLVFRLKKLTFAKTFAITTRPRALRPFFFIFTLGMDNMRLARRLSTTARSSRLSRPRTYLEKFALEKYFLRPGNLAAVLRLRLLCTLPRPAVARCRLLGLST